MPSYDIIPLASDLLDYTIQRVKQKDPEYRQVKAYVMENGQMVEKTLYERLKDNGKPHFPKSQAFHLCAELQSCALRILRGCVAANGRYFETEYEERLKDLDGVLIECETMGQLINLSFKRKYITGDQCHYWAELVRPVRQKAFNWRKSDGNRAALSGRPKRPGSLPRWGKWLCKWQRLCGLNNGCTGPKGRVFGCDLFILCYLPEHEQHQQRHLPEHQRQCQQQQLHQHQRVPPRSDGKARPSRPKAKSSAIHHIKGGHIQP